MVAVAGAAAGQATAVVPPVAVVTPVPPVAFEPPVLATTVPPVPPVAFVPTVLATVPPVLATVPPVLATVPPVLATVPPVLATVPPVPVLATTVPPVPRVQREDRSEVDVSTDPDAPAVPSAVVGSSEPTSLLQATAPHTMDRPRTKEMPLIIRGAQFSSRREVLERDGATARTQ